MIDGVNSLDNILVIGMTNRKDLLDDAILRPGRFEVHVKISIANEEGRKQILNIHTKHMRENNLLDENVSIDALAKLTKNYTGAEIESLVNSAKTFAFSRETDLFNFNKNMK